MKKVLAVSMTVLMMLLSFFSVTAFAVGEEYVVFEDCAWMALVINGHRSPSDIELLAADCNGDEVLTVDDYQNIINTALQQ